MAGLLAIYFGGVKITGLGMLLPWVTVIPDLVAIPLTLVLIVGVTNAINLSDGLDGLAGGITLLSFLCIGYLAFQAERPDIIMFCVAVSGAVFGFLVFNTHPANIFMGDTGSQLLGYLAATLSVALTQHPGPLSPMLPVILLGFPILDTATVMCERVARGVSPFVADRNHFHHKLMKIGLLHKESVLAIYFIQCLLVVFALRFRFHSEWFLLGMYLLFAGVVVSGFHLADRTGWTLKRFDLIDGIVRARLGSLRDSRVMIRVSFRAVEYGLPALLVATALMASEVPRYVTWLSLGLIALIVAVWCIRKTLLDRVLRVSLYLTIPFITYLGQHYAANWMGGAIATWYGISFLAVFLSVILTVKYTSRRKGFRSTPTDFLILFIALVLPNLSGDLAFTRQMGLLTVKILVFFFGFEILMGELRGNVTRLGITTVAVMALVAVKGIL
jgi:UDP-GlcNAc:undecaprenyl-phosphate GlcNAc-1-phosphate transferase